MKNSITNQQMERTLPNIWGDRRTWLVSNTRVIVDASSGPQVSRFKFLLHKKKEKQSSSKQTKINIKSSVNQMVIR